VRALTAAEAATLTASLGFAPERLPGFAWSAAGLRACTDETSVCLHRGSAFADDWVREIWVVAPPGQWLAAARRYCRHLFAGGARQLRWSVALPVEPSHEAVWGRYGVLPISVRDDVLTLALDDPQLPPSLLTPWPRTFFLGMGLSLSAVRYSELTQIAAWAQIARNYEPLGYGGPITLDQLVGGAVPRNPLHHARLRTHLYGLRRRGMLVGVVFDRQRDYEGDILHELDLVITDETLPPQVWAHASTVISDVCYRRGVTRIVINVREDFAGLAGCFGAESATPWIARAATTRTHYTATAEQFRKSLFARRFLHQRVQG
jgi:hypothetical protein